MEPILQVAQALAVIGNVCKISNTTWVNKRQCKCIADRFNGIGEGLKALLLDESYFVGGKCSHDNSSSKDLPAIDKLLAVLQRGEALILQHSGWKGFIPWVDNREAFKEIHEDLDTMKVQFDFEGSRKPELVKELGPKSDFASGDSPDLPCPTTTWGNTTVAGGVSAGESHPVSVPMFLEIKPSDIKKVRRIGKGASAKVYKATCFSYSVAVKRFKPEYSRMVQQEVNCLIKLNHSHIVRLMGLSVDWKERCSIVMELMDDSLRELIIFRMAEKRSAENNENSNSTASIPFTPSEALDVITKISLGMAYLHSMGVSHRDLKSHNVLVRCSGGYIEVKIVDFGFSLNLDSDEVQALSNAGTGLWRGPEILQLAKDKSMKPDLMAADVYSFAMTCYEVLTGKLPFQDELFERKLKHNEYKKVIEGLRPKLPSNLDGNLRRLIEICWNSNPKLRPKFENICDQLAVIQVIQNVCNISSIVWANKHQCKRIANRFSAIAEGTKALESDKDFDDSTNKDHLAFDAKLLTVLRKGEALVSMYDKSKGISTLVSQTDNREAFKEIHEELNILKAKFYFESFVEPGEVKSFDSTSGVERSELLIADAERDLEENLELLAQMTNSEQTTGIDNMKEATQVAISEKNEPRRASVDLLTYQIDLANVEIKEPVRKYVRHRERDQDDSWVDVHFGTWLGCTFACKVFKSGVGDGGTWNKKQLLTEVNSLHRLQHPHIVRFVGFGQDPGRYCVLLMELMDMDLRDFMKQKLKCVPKPKPRPFTRSEELDIITQIAKGMYFMHTHKYSHGDLNCSNILVKKSNDYLEVKIANLRRSLNLEVWDAEVFKQISMTRRPHWTAPEAIKHYSGTKPSSDLLKKGDVYGFGMTCYEVVTGEYPFDEIRGEELLKHIIEVGVRPELPGELDEDLKELIERCWDHVPRKRPEFEIVCHLLDYIRSKKPVAESNRSCGKDTVLSLIKRIPQVSKIFVVSLGVVSQSKAQSIDFPSHESSVSSEGGVQSEGDISIPEYLRIQPDKLIKKRRIGNGASARVYEATWLGCKFALREFSYRSTIQELQKDLQFLIKLRHPYLAEMVGLSVNSNQQCSIVMGLMSNNLRELIDSRIQKRTRVTPFDLHESLLIITKIALGMAFLHSKGVVHRDLKSTNVMVREHLGSIDVKIVDFGLSLHEHIADSNETKRPYLGVGTGFWRAPEIFPIKSAERSKTPDFKAADVYSFAMTCYEVLTGGVPFSDLMPRDYNVVISGRRPILPCELDEDLKGLIKRCWNGDPNKRPEFQNICHRLHDIISSKRLVKMLDFQAYGSTISGVISEGGLQQSNIVVSVPEDLRIKEGELNIGRFVRMRRFGKLASVGVYHANRLGSEVAAFRLNDLASTQDLQQELNRLITLCNHPCMLQFMGLSVDSNQQSLIVMEPMYARTN